MYANIYVQYDYKHVKICTRGNNGRECIEIITEFIFMWWNYRFFQIYIHIKDIMKHIRHGHKERGAGVGFNKGEET